MPCTGEVLVSVDFKADVSSYVEFSSSYLLVLRIHPTDTTVDQSVDDICKYAHGLGD